MKEDFSKSIEALRVEIETLLAQRIQASKDEVQGILEKQRETIEKMKGILKVEEIDEKERERQDFEDPFSKIPGKAKP